MLIRKPLYSAVAGSEIDGDAREMALELGMYAVETVEDTKYVNIIKPFGKRRPESVRIK